MAQLKNDFLPCRALVLNLNSLFTDFFILLRFTSYVMFLHVGASKVALVRLSHIPSLIKGNASTRTLAAC